MMRDERSSGLRVWPAWSGMGAIQKRLAIYAVVRSLQPGATGHAIAEEVARRHGYRPITPPLYRMLTRLVDYGYLGRVPRGAENSAGRPPYYYFPTAKPYPGYDEMAARPKTQEGRAA